MVTGVKTFRFSAELLGDDGLGGPRGPEVDERIDSWAQEKRVRIVSASVSALTSEGDTYGCLAIVVYERDGDARIV